MAHNAENLYSRMIELMCGLGLETLIESGEHIDLGICEAWKIAFNASTLEPFEYGPITVPCLRMVLFYEGMPILELSNSMERDISHGQLGPLREAFADALEAVWQKVGARGLH